MKTVNITANPNNPSHISAIIALIEGILSIATLAEPLVVSIILAIEDSVHPPVVVGPPATPLAE